MFKCFNEHIVRIYLTLELILNPVVAQFDKNYVYNLKKIGPTLCYFFFKLNFACCKKTNRFTKVGPALVI